MSTTATVTASDRDLQRRVLGYLVSRQVPALRQLDVEADRGVVTLKGRLCTFYEKQLALNACQRVAGVYKLVDQIVA